MNTIKKCVLNTATMSKLMLKCELLSPENVSSFIHPLMLSSSRTDLSPHVQPGCWSLIHRGNQSTWKKIYSGKLNSPRKAQPGNWTWDLHFVSQEHSATSYGCSLKICIDCIYTMQQCTLCIWKWIHCILLTHPTSITSLKYEYWLHLWTHVWILI